MQAALHFHCQQSLELTLNFEHRSLSALERSRAETIFFQVLEPPLDLTSFTSLHFNPILLLRLSLEQNPSEQGKENFLTFILRNYYEESRNSLDPVSFIQVLDRLEQTVSTWSPSPPPWVGERTVELANHLVYFFFLPCKFYLGRIEGLDKPRDSNAATCQYIMS